MSILSMFNINPAATRIDHVWLTDAAMMKGIIKHLSENKTDLCIAWFEDTREKFNRFLNTENHMNMQITMAESLTPQSLDNRIVVFLEHYPLHAKESALLSGKKAAKIFFMSSLEDVIFQLFGGNIAGMMRSMGLPEDEFIESGLVSSAITRAQKRLQKKVKNDFHARSGAEWMHWYKIQYGK